VQVAGGDGEAKLGEAAQQRSEGKLAFHAGQHGAEAVVDAVPERQVTGLGPADVEQLRARISTCIPVRGGQS
jgi:hypothetical protein